MKETPLQESLETFSKDWLGDFSAGWKSVFQGVALDLAGVDPGLPVGEEPIFPGRKSQPNPGGAPGADVFKAFARLQPADVRAVIIGQDPYPQLNRATGRAFEQGDITDWSSGVTKSMKSFLLTLAAQRSGDAKYFSASAWPVLQADLHNGALSLPVSPTALFDRLEDQGVLCLNAGLTLSKFVKPIQNGHIRFWSPLIKQVILSLAKRPNRQLVFLCWGKDAQDVVKNSGVRALPAWGVNADMSAHPHPATPTYWTPPNPLADANARLKKLGGTAIDW